jgi:AbrB family looped-hinge helix DNA binding protein
MKSTITARGQTVIPAAIRRKLGLTPSDRLEWVITSEGVHVIPVKPDPIDALRGSGRGGGTTRLVEERRADAGEE